MPTLKRPGLMLAIEKVGAVHNHAVAMFLQRAVVAPRSAIDTDKERTRVNAPTDPEAIVARFVEKWSRRAELHNSWKSLEPPPPPRQIVAAEGATQEPNYYAQPSQAAEPTGDAIDRARLETAARWALVAFPGPVGELVSREISDYLSFGFRFDGSGLVPRLVDQVLASKLSDNPS